MQNNFTTNDYNPKNVCNNRWAKVRWAKVRWANVWWVKIRAPKDMDAFSQSLIRKGDIRVLRSTMGGVSIFQTKRVYEGVRFNVISVLRGCEGGCKFSRNNYCVTLKWHKKNRKLGWLPSM